MPDLVIDTARMLIDGQQHDALSGETLDVLNPSTGALITRVPAGGHPDVDAAQAFERWSRVPARRESKTVGPTR